MNANQQPGIPDFTSNPQPQRPDEERTVILPNGPYAGYTGADFPAPAGFRRSTRTPPRRQCWSGRDAELVP